VLSLLLMALFFGLTKLLPMATALVILAGDTGESARPTAWWVDEHPLRS